MSRPFRDKNKDLVNLTVVSAKYVWQVKNDKPTLRRDIDIFGRVDKETSAFVTNTTLNGEKHSFVDDTNKLPKRIKQQVVDLLKNKNNRVAYIVKKKSDKPTKER